MRRAVQAIFLSILAAEVLVVGQGADAKRVLSELRTALGGEDKLAAVKTVSIEGQVTRPLGNGSSSASNFEMAFELPDKYMKSDVYANMNGMELKRRSGFNGAEPFEEMDVPPGMMGGGGMHMMRMSPGGPLPGGQATPEQVAAQRAQLLVSSKREFARLVLGMFGTSFTPLPLEFKYGGQAESQDGKADVLEIQGPDGFTAKLFVDGKTHLPLMLSWMDREPIRMTMGPGGGAAAAGGGGGNVQVFSGGAGGGRMTPEDVARMQQDMAERVKQAEANRRTVEFRMFYGEYKPVSGVNLPTKIQRMMDGLPTEEVSFEKVKVNTKIDTGKFKVVK